MTISTYAELSTAVANFLHRSGLTDRVPEFITLGEARIGREVKAREMEQRTSSTPSDNTESLPSDYVAMRAIRIKGSTLGWLDYKTPDWYFGTTPSSQAGNHNWYTIFGDELIFPITPSGDIELWYYKKLAALSSATNTLFTRNPDLYLYAALAEASVFLGSNDRKLAMYEGKFASVRESVNLADKMGRFPAGVAVKAA